MEEDRKAYKILVEKLECKRPLERPRCRWDDGIRMHLRDWLGGVEWIKLAQDRGRWWALVNTVMTLQVLAPHTYLGHCRKYFHARCFVHWTFYEPG
jgi:hypothetical protein